MAIMVDPADTIQFPNVQGYRYGSAIKPIPFRYDQLFPIFLALALP